VLPRGHKAERGGWSPSRKLRGPSIEELGELFDGQVLVPEREVKFWSEP